jgi:hypothetical protein
MTAPQALDILMNDLLDNAIELWKRDKMVATVSWAFGPRLSAFAQPYDREGWDVSLEARVGLHAMVAACVEAEYIGRIDESWVKAQDNGSTPIVHGELQQMADYDPDVKTAICVQSYHLPTGRGYLYMASLELHEDGSEKWTRTYCDDPEGRIVTGSELTARVIPIFNDGPDLTPDVVEEFLNALHWTVVVTGADA